MNGGNITGLLGTEQVTLVITPDAIREIAKIAAQVNETLENIGARRLQTVMEKLLDELHEMARRLDDRMCSIDRIMAAEDPNGRVACETATTTGLILVFGEITTDW